MERRGDHRRWARERRPDAQILLAETVRLGSATLSPAVRDGDVIGAGPGVVERVLRGSFAAAAAPAFPRARSGSSRQRAGRAQIHHGQRRRDDPGSYIDKVLMETCNIPVVAREGAASYDALSQFGTTVRELCDGVAAA